MKNGGRKGKRNFSDSGRVFCSRHRKGVMALGQDSDHLEIVFRKMRVVAERKQFHDARTGRFEGFCESAR